MRYYSIPLRVDEIMKGKRIHEEEDIRLAIHKNIRLILRSFFLSYRFDPTFGCVMNKFHASTPPQGRSERAWREKMREAIQKNLKEMLIRYETRVKVQDVIIDLVQPKRMNNNAAIKVKVEVIGQLTLGRREKFHYPDSEISEDAEEVFPLMIPVGRVSKS